VRRPKRQKKTNREQRGGEGRRRREQFRKLMNEFFENLTRAS
jgi:hypothetical protein